MFPQYPNPINDFYFRNAALQNQQSQFAQQMQIPPMQPNSANQIICRYVTNIEEAKAAMIDALGTYIFVDTANGKMYLKRMNNNGLSDFYTYIIEEKNPAAATKDPFSEINERLCNIENSIGELRNYDKSIPEPIKSARNSKAAAASENESNGKSESSHVQQNAGND